MVSQFLQRRSHTLGATLQAIREQGSIDRFSKRSRRTLQNGTRENQSKVKASQTREDLTKSHCPQGQLEAIVHNIDKVYIWTKSRSWTWITKSLKWRWCRRGGKSQVSSTYLKTLLRKSTSIVPREEMGLSVEWMRTLVVAHLTKKCRTNIYDKGCHYGHLFRFYAHNINYSVKVVILETLKFQIKKFYLKM